jgi:hypothetical protein
LLGDGGVPSTGNPPALVDDGIHLAEMRLSLGNQPVESAIADSEPFFFLFYKVVSQASAMSAAAATFPGTSIQAVPEPATLALFSTMIFGFAAVRRPGRRRRV